MHTLLRQGANVQAQETAGEYPLHVASSYLADKAVDLLLRYYMDGEHPVLPVSYSRMLALANGAV